MFDIGFTELLLTAVIALVVIGPKRLPETIRTVGLWVGRTKRALNRAYQEMDRELGLDDIRRQLHNEEVMRSLEEHKKRLEAEILGKSRDESDKPDSGATETTGTTASAAAEPSAIKDSASEPSSPEHSPPESSIAEPSFQEPSFQEPSAQEPSTPSATPPPSSEGASEAPSRHKDNRYE